jgi:hypothetical protein
MSMSRWKVLACTLTVGVGGLAVFATPPMADKKESPKEPAPLPNLSVKPATPPNGDDTPAPVKPATNELNIEIPSVPTVTKSEEPAKKPASEPIFEPVGPPVSVILPVKGEEAKEPVKLDDKSAKPVEPPSPAKPIDLQIPSAPTRDLEIPVIAAPTPSKPTRDLDIPIIAVPTPSNPTATPPVTVKPGTVAPPAADLEVLPPIGPASKPMPPAAAPKPDTVPPVVTPDPVPPVSSTLPPMDVKPAVVPEVKAPEVKVPTTTIIPTKPAESAKLKLLLRMGDGQPRFEIRNTANSDLLLKVFGEKVEMQAPPESRSSLAGVTAIGRVRFIAPGIEGTCDHLTILSGTGEVLMKGNIHMKTKHGKSWSEMTAEKMVYQIGTSGLASPGTSRPPVTPASYIPD